MSLVVECEPHRELGDREAGLDWGVETLATLAYAPGEYDGFENDRHLAVEQDALQVEQRALSSALRGKRSKRAAKTKRAMARRHRKIANRRKNRNHQITARLVRDHKLIVTEDLAVGNMTASASFKQQLADDAVASSGRVSTCPVLQLKGVPDGKAPKLRRFAA